jgi:hypothetical protein
VIETTPASQEKVNIFQNETRKRLCAHEIERDSPTRMANQQERVGQ